MTERGPGSRYGATIQSPPQLPVIADGLFQHYTRPASPQTYETDAVAEHQPPEVHVAGHSVHG